MWARAALSSASTPRTHSSLSSACPGRRARFQYFTGSAGLRGSEYNARGVILCPHPHVRENGFQRSVEFVVIVFTGVERIGSGGATRLSVVSPVGSGNQQHAVRAQHLSGIGQKRAGIAQVFNRFEGRNGVERPFGERQGLA